jgi:hypothetical protein
MTLRKIQMHRDKTKLKYMMGIWKHLPQYPSKEDIVYEISVYLIKDGRPNGEFSLQTLKSVFGKDWENNSHGEIIKKMIEDGDLQRGEKKDMSKEWYKIANNTYY